MVPSTTGPTCASVITAAWYMESAAQTMNISAPRVRLLPPNVLYILNIMRKFQPLHLNLIILAEMVILRYIKKHICRIQFGKFVMLLCVYVTGTSCKGRCGESFKRGRLCSCDPDCMKFKQCCSDVTNHCDAGETFF